MKEPTISVIIPTFNSQKTIILCLDSIYSQNYTESKLEVIAIDGGSTDNTLNILKKYKVRLVKADPVKQNVEYNKSLGIQKAKNELLLMIDHDNIFPSKNILKSMIKPFIENKDMVGVETLRYHYQRNLSVLDRYFALFAVTDPIAHYLGKADRLSYLYDKPNFDNYKEYDDYYVVKFDEKKIPTIGANGFLVKRSLLLEHANIKPGSFFPIDVNVDLINKGFNTYAFTKNSITHIAGHGNVIYYLKRRMFFVKQFYLGGNKSRNNRRRYSVFEKKDLNKLIYFVFISVTFIIPFIDSMRGYKKINDKAWFLHPVMCFGFVLIYGYVILEHQVKVIMKKV